MKTTQNKEITKEEIQEIERLTGGMIGEHTFGPNNESTLTNSFLSKKGDYVGGIDETDNPVIEGMYGYTHRGGQLFKIGDRLFDREYKPTKDDFPEDEWNKYQEQFNKLYEESDDISRDWMKRDGISYILPFKLRGSKIIENMEDAFEAAKNISNYLS